MPRSIIDTDKRLTDRDISDLVGVHKATACRWRVKGVPAADGSRVKLPYTRAGKRAYVHPDDLREFLAKLTELDQQQQEEPVSAATVPRPSSTSKQASRAEAAEQRADQMNL